MSAWQYYHFHLAPRDLNCACVTLDRWCANLQHTGLYSWHDWNEFKCEALYIFWENSQVYSETCWRLESYTDKSAWIQKIAEVPKVIKQCISKTLNDCCPGLDNCLISIKIIACWKVFYQGGSRGTKLLLLNLGKQQIHCGIRLAGKA